MKIENRDRMRDTDTGYACWLAFRELEDKVPAAGYLKWCSKIVVLGNARALFTAAGEIKSGIGSMLGKAPRIIKGTVKPRSIILGILGESEPLDAMAGDSDMELVEDEGYLLKMLPENEGGSLLLAGKTGAGIMHGAFALLARLRMQSDFNGLHLVDNPRYRLRMLNHWDNMDGGIERGYAGRSIFFKNGRFPADAKRFRDYARLLCSLGINGISINNVNVHNAEMSLISDRLLPRIAKAAAVLREYGIKLYLSINYSSPMALGELQTADPLDEGVKKWWRDNTSNIYKYIPDFGGYIVKADSEFLPGPFTYGRDHAQGANMLADALAPHGGLVIWRCFVYNCRQDWRDRKTDRANAAYDNFMPLDGKFRDNVVLQIKNGPMDFQVREPVSPLIGGLKKTNHIVEFQITQEYTGQQKHLCYLIPQWKTVLDFDTHAKGKGSTVKKILDGSLFPQKYHGMSAVANIGDDMNWTGHDLAQANLYGYGRLAWDPELTAEKIAEEWIRMTYGNNGRLLETLSGMLLSSWRIYENYTVPLGIGWMVNPGHHYGPSVDGYEYSAWGTYHRADFSGIGVDRSVGTGTGYAGKYHFPNAEAYESIETCPEELLLFFHRVAYKYRLKSGKTLIQHIYDTHFEGVAQALELLEKWKSLKELVPAACYERVLKRFEVQSVDAKEWCDVVNSYFFRKSGIKDEKDRMIY